MDDQAKPRQAADYQLEEFDDELLLYHPVKTQAVHLNATATLIWRLCDGQRTIAEIRRLLQDTYALSVDQAIQDIDATLEQFSECGAIEFV